MEIDTTTGEVGDQTSSMRYKDNIRDYQAGDEFFQLRPVMVDRKDGSRTDELCFIAEEVAVIYPEMARYERQAIYEDVPDAGDPNITARQITRYELTDQIRGYSQLDLLPIMVSAMKQMKA